MTHIMVDLETLDISPTSVILSIGAVKFDPRKPTLEPWDPLYILPEIDTQLDLGRTVNDDTIEWWAKQSGDVIEQTFTDDNRVSFKEAITQFTKWLFPLDYIWSNGSIFDIMILENAYAQLETSVPWNYHQIRDVRTIYDLGDPCVNNSNKHNALDDAIAQAKAVTNIYGQLNIGT